jgi:hypothetical protein
VSERSFNDKLAKLQIHSFQNVKFMSQFKRNMNAAAQGDSSKGQHTGPKNLEQYLAE